MSLFIGNISLARVARTFIFSFCLLFSFIPTGFGQSWEWASRIGGTSSDVIRASVIDPSGDIFIAGGFSGTSVTFGSTVVTSPGSNNMCLAKYDSSGNVIWAKGIPCGASDLILSAKTDPSGNVYIAGWFFSNSISFGSVTLVNDTPSGYTADIFLAKYDASGNVLWARRAGGAGNEAASAVATDAAGNVFITGNFASPVITFGAVSLTNAGSVNGDFFVTKYDSAGNVLWAKSAGNGLNEGGLSIATDVSGNAYVVGTKQQYTINFGAVSLYPPGAFLVKYDVSGNAVWAKNIEPNTTYNFSVATDLEGYVYVAGQFTDTSIVLGTTTLTNTGSEDIFLGKYDPSGNNVWARSASGTNFDIVNAVTTDANGYVYITGDFRSPVLTFGAIGLMNTDSTIHKENIFLAKYDASGSVIWARSTGGDNDNDSRSVAVDNAGGVYISGIFKSDTLVFGTTALLDAGAAGYQDMFFAKLNSTTGTPIIPSVDKHIAIYPNPNTGQMTVQLAGSGCTSLQVFDCLGRQVYRSMLTGKESTDEMNMQAIAPGLYYLHATGSASSENIPFVISR